MIFSEYLDEGEIAFQQRHKFIMIPFPDVEGIPNVSEMLVVDGSIRGGNQEYAAGR
jgi:hypothetical protein